MIYSEKDLLELLGSDFLEYDVPERVNYNDVFNSFTDEEEE